MMLPKAAWVALVTEYAFIFFFSSMWLVELLRILMVALSQWRCVVCGGCGGLQQH